MKKSFLNKGFTLVETIAYMSLLILISVVVIQNMVSLFSSYSQIRVSQDMETTAIQVLDKISRDVRNATAIVENQSSFNIPESYVTLSVPNTLGGTDTLKYYATGGRVNVDRNGSYLGSLSLPSITVNNFELRYINGTSTKALKIWLSVQAPIRDNPGIVYENFYTTVQMRD